MGLFGQSTPFDADIEKATSETNTNENWSLILNVCDKVQTQPRNAKECLKVIMKRLGHADPHVVMQAITLLDACSNNCGKSFHLEIASREFENEFRRLLAKAQPKVSLKMRQVLKNWAENDYKNDPELNLIPSLYSKLRLEGLDFSNLNEKPPKSAAAKVAAAAAAKDPNVVSSQQEEDDIAKAIELSLKESGKGSPKQTSGGNGVSGGGGGGSGGGGSSSASTAYPSLYPSFSGSGSMASITSTGGASNNSASSQPEPRKVRALYDFEAVEENELTFFAGEIIHVLEDTDPNWWKGFTQRAEGLFPSNFVTADLSVDPERLDINQQNKSKKSVQFEDDTKELQQKTEAAAAAAAKQRIEIDEAKVDRLLHLLHEANPEDPSQDSDEMLRLEQEVHQMGPLIDAELERVDRKHAQLTQLSSDLVDAINLYHSLMRDDRAAMMGGVGAFMAGMPGHGGYQGAPPNPQMLYGAAGYPGAATFPQQQMPQSYGMSSMPYAAAPGQLPTTHNSPMPSISVAATTAPGGPYPPSVSNAQLSMGNAQPQQMPIAMQFQNGHINGGAINALPQNMSTQMASGPVPPPQQQPNYQMLPPQQQQQQQQPQITTATTASQMPPNGQALIVNNQLQQQHQSTAPSHQQFTSLPPQHQQNPQQQQPQAPFMQQQQQQHQVAYASITNGPQAYMGVATQQATAGGVMMQQPLPPHQQPQQQLNHNHQNNGDQFSQLQQQMAAMSMGGGGVGGMTLGGGIMNQQQNYLVQNETKNNIPIYQQQR